MSRIAVVGTGYVGLVTGACLADFGNDVRCVDVDATKIASLEALRDELRRLVKACAGGRVASCLIIGALGDHRHCGTDHRPG